MDSATEFLFGSCVDSLACTPPYPHNASARLPLAHDSPRAQAANAFTEAYSEAMHQIAFRQRVGWIWPLFEMFNDKTAKPMEVVSEYIDPIIHAAVDKKKATEKGTDSSDDSSLLDELLKSTSGKHQFSFGLMFTDVSSLDPKLLKDEMCVTLKISLMPLLTLSLQHQHFDSWEGHDHERFDKCHLFVRVSERFNFDVRFANWS
jgi:hypothetical protein